MSEASAGAEDSPQSRRSRVGSAARTGGLILLLVLLAPFVVSSVPQVVGADASYVVLSDSMAPAMHAGDVVIVREVPPSAIGTGDVVTYDQTGTAVPVTHRVVEVHRQGDQRRFTTKGDANDAPDREPIPASAVEGRVVGVLPLIGHVIRFSRTDVGAVLLLVIPGLLLVGTELRTLIRGNTATDGPDPTNPDGTASEGGGSANRASDSAAPGQPRERAEHATGESA
jgi:signal peptidase